MIEIKSMQYRVQICETFNAIRSFGEERIEGHDFQVTYRFVAGTLTNSEVINRDDLKALTAVMQGIDLGQLTSPKPPTNENVVRILGQRALDYLFRMELNEVVRLCSVRLTVRPGEYAEVLYHY
jgi:hypothetical protein